MVPLRASFAIPTEDYFVPICARFRQHLETYRYPAAWLYGVCTCEPLFQQKAFGNCCVSLYFTRGLGCGLNYQGILPYLFHPLSFGINSGFFLTSKGLI